MRKQIERVLSVERVEDLIAVFGSFDENTKRIEEALDVKIINRGTDLKVAGDEENVDKAIRTLEGLLALFPESEDHLGCLFCFLTTQSGQCHSR